MATKRRMVQVMFTEETKYGTFTDALYYPEGSVPSDALLDGEIQARRNQYVAAIDAAKLIPPVIITKEQLQAEKAELEARIAVLDAEIGKK